MSNDQPAPTVFMQEAIQLSTDHMRNGDGGPFGAVVVKDGKVIGRGWNQVTGSNDPTAHAEIVAIREACQRLKSFLLDGCELYASCEPCPMCLGAIYWARISRLFFAATRRDATDAGFDDETMYREVALHPSDRTIPTIQILRDSALTVFSEWRSKSDKIPY